MKHIESFLAKLSELDIKLWVEDGKLKCNAPQGTLTDELKQQLSDNKTELLSIFSEELSSRSINAIAGFSNGKDIPLTQGQKRIWSLANLRSDSSVYNVPMVFMLKGPLDRISLEKSLLHIHEKHDILRTIFIGESVDCVRQLIKQDMALPFKYFFIGHDLQKMPQKQVNRTINDLLRTEVRKPFVLSEGPLWRCHLFGVDKNKHLLIITVHHIIFDGLSRTIFLKELSELYRKIKLNLLVDINKPQCQFSDFSCWQKEYFNDFKLDKQLQYWEDKFRTNAFELMLPNDKKPVSGDKKADSISFTIPGPLTSKITKQGKEEQVSNYVVLLTAFCVLLNRLTEQESILICTPVANRDYSVLENMIGYFNNIVIISADLSGSPTFKTLLKRIHRETLNTLDNQNISLQDLVKLPKLTRVQLSKAMFSYQDVSSSSLELTDIKVSPISIRKDAADFDLAVYTEKNGDLITGVIDYNSNIFKRDTIISLINLFSKVLNYFVVNPDEVVESFYLFKNKINRLERAERALNKNDKIDQSVVLADKKTGLLTSYLVLNEHNIPSLKDIKDYAVSCLPDYCVPSCFIPVDELPLLPDGRIDNALLESFYVNRINSNDNYVAPRNELEEHLCNIWKDVLWLDSLVGVNDSFISLGGHSLLAVQLIAEVEKKLDCKIPLKAINQLDTVANMAIALTNPEAFDDEFTKKNNVNNILPKDIYVGLRSYTSSWVGKRSSDDSIIVGLNSEGAKRNLFWCLQRYQELKQLAKYLGPDQPVYGMRSGNNVMVKTQDNINLLASYYVNEILEIQKEGPFLIGGNCQAAQIAFQVADQLSKDGHKIELLILMEKFVPFKYEWPILMLFGEDSDRNPIKNFHDPFKGWFKYYHGPLDMKLIPGSHGLFFKEPNVNFLADTIKDAIDYENILKMPLSYREENYNWQLLEDSSYRAEISTSREKYQASVGSFLEIDVNVKNTSTIKWLPTDQSCIIISGRWTHNNCLLESKIVVNKTIYPEECIESTLKVKVPDSLGQWNIEIDLIEDGITWFKDKGSYPLYIDVIVE